MKKKSFPEAQRSGTGGRRPGGIQGPVEKVCLLEREFTELGRPRAMGLKRSKDIPAENEGKGGGLSV